MDYPYLQGRKRQEFTRTHFLGYNHNLKIAGGEFFYMENMTSDHFPLLSPRKKRGIFRKNIHPTGMIAKDSLCWTAGSKLFLNGYEVELGLSQGDKQLVSMGAYVLVFPDGKYLNTADLTDRGSIDREFISHSAVYLCPCRPDGTEIKYQFVGGQTPENPGDRALWLDGKELKQYDGAADLWVAVAATYIKLTCPGLGEGFRQGDGVAVTGLDGDFREVNGWAVIESCGTDFLVIPGLAPGAVSQEKEIRISRNCPRMDFVTESGNRLWGCRYGPDRDGQAVNELYCCKLGDFRNWSCYQGISTDSYRVSLGSDGPFTGAVCWQGQPIFFKEKAIHRVFGHQPSQFQVQTENVPGVGKGCGKSLAPVGGILYYQGASALYAYDGSSPRDISQPLGTEFWGGAAAAGWKDKYYLSREYAPGKWELLVLDTRRQLWHREDALEGRCFCPCREELYCADGAGDILALGGSGEEQESYVNWEAVTGLLGADRPGHKRLVKLKIRMTMDPGSRVTASVRYDSLGSWEILGTAMHMSLRSTELTLLPRRCDHLQLKLSGQGEAKVFSLTQVWS